MNTHPLLSRRVPGPGQRQPVRPRLPDAPGHAGRAVRGRRPDRRRRAGARPGDGQDARPDVVIENKLGAGGTLAANFVAKAAPDGYTILIHHNGMATAPALYRKLPFNPLTDFEYVTQAVDVPMTLLGRKDLPPNNLHELIAYLKANATKINLAHAGLGAVSHLCGMVFRQAIGVELQTVPYQGTAPALNALLGGQVDLLCDQTTQTTQHIKAETVKLYGVTTLERIKALPNAPTLNELGMKGFQVVVWHGVYAPKGTPQAALDKINGAVRAALKDPTFASAWPSSAPRSCPRRSRRPKVCAAG